MADATEPERAAVDEAKIARLAALSLPIVTLLLAVGVSITLGLATGLLVIAAGVLLGAIAIFWSSLRVLSGDAELPPELDELERSAHGADALSSRKTMLIRALKDLENERDIGKLDEADFAQLSATYRADLKHVLRRIDAGLDPHRERAEEMARAFLTQEGLLQPADAQDAAGAPPTSDPPSPAPARRLCPKCAASNESDAKFCKECATPLASEPPAEVPSDEPAEEPAHEG